MFLLALALVGAVCMAMWLLVVVRAPGAGPVRALAERWLDPRRGGIAPAQALLLIPVTGLAMQLLGPGSWFGVRAFTGLDVALIDLGVATAMLVLVFRSRVWAATLAEAGLLVAVGMSLRAAERLFASNPQAALALVTEAKESSSRALTELRHLVRGIYPPVLADRGLGDAIRALALDTPLPTVVDVDLPGEVEMPVAAAVYFSVAEALANAAKHAHA